MKLKKILLLVSLIMLHIHVSAQVFPYEKRIYLLDITASMTGFGKGNIDIFDKVKQQLAMAINEIDKNTEIAIIPYTSKVYPTITGTKQEILSKLNNIKTIKEDTNIDAAWAKGLSLLDSTKVNYLFLLTDGRHNNGVGKSDFYRHLSSWSEKSMGRFYFAFYIMLTENADDQEIRNITLQTPQMWSIMTMDVNVSIVLTPFSVKTKTYKKTESAIKIRCNHPKELKNISGFRVTLDDNPYYTISRSYIDTKSQTLRIALKEKIEHSKIPVEYKLNARLYYNREKTPLLFFTPDKINIKVRNVGRKTMTFKQDLNRNYIQKK